MGLDAKLNTTEKRSKWEILEEAEAADVISAKERCIRQFALIAVKNAKFHSNQPKANQSIVEIVIKSEDRNTKRVHSYFILKLFFFLFSLFFSKF